uniref:Glutaredoxin-1 n=1 Tax=Panagrolaimus superbus TaxID=310955 RepID=A0A914YJL6_9BILA
MSDVQTFVDEKIGTHKVAVFSKSHCPFCHKAKAALESFKFKPNEFFWLEIEDRKDCREMQDYLLKVTGERTVPRVFINGRFYGGGTETEAAYLDGSLEKTLIAAGALE